MYKLQMTFNHERVNEYISDLDKRVKYSIMLIKSQVIDYHEQLAVPVYRDQTVYLYSGSNSHLLYKRFIELPPIVSNHPL